MNAPDHAVTPMQKPVLPLRDHAIQAALDLAAAIGWDRVTMNDIAESCGYSLADLCDMFEDRAAILAAYGRRIDRAVLDRVHVDPAASERDRLFDVLMERFDVLNENRAGLLAILSGLRADPRQAVTGLPHLGRSMTWMLEAANIDTIGPRGAATAVGLLGVYLYAVKAWIKDESPDMAKTMAALDKALDRAEKLARFLPA